MISCVEWIPKGAADPNPKRYELSKQEHEYLEQQAKEDMEGYQAALNGGKEEDNNDDEYHSSEEEREEEPKTAAQIIASQKIDPSSLPADLRMDDYSDDEDGNGNEASIGKLLIGKDNEIMGTHLDEDGKPVMGDSDDEDSDDDLADVPDTREFLPTNVEGLEAMAIGGRSSLNDYIDDEDEDDDNDSDVEDTNLQPDDALVIVAKTEEDFASLEVHVYEEKTGNLFVHHDIPLPSYPLCLAHGTINSDGQAGNYVAVGTFNPGIEVWNLDVLDALEPTCILGGEDTSAAEQEWDRLNNPVGSSNIKKKKKKKKKIGGNGLRSGSHTEAVMALSWNPIHRQVLASGSADTTIKLWDITKADNPKDAVATTFAHHCDKVQSLAWHPTEGTILASGSYDQSLCIIDARSSQDEKCKRVKLPADCEAIAWDPHQPHFLTAASEDGSVICWDVRKFETGMPYWSFVAHEFGGCSDLSYNPNVPGMFATCAIDKTVALWDTYNVSSNPNECPFACGSKDMKVGKLFTASFYPSSPWLLACGGGGNELALWDLSSESLLKKRFGSRIVSAVDPAGIIEMDDNNEKDGDTNNDFEAMMAAGDKVADKMREQATSKNKKKKGKSKKKVHRR